MGLRERTIFGKYRVLARLGRGGMGDVFLAVNIGPAGVSKLIVVKELREQLASMPEARSMFLDEARIASRLNHPNVVQTYEVIEDGDSLYITMEYLEGQPLQHIIRGARRAQVPLVLQLQILAETLAALHYAHELTDYDGTPLAVVHRDVSPHNVIVTFDGTAKLLDFGIAKAADAKTVTESGVFKGKVRFSAPEQIVGGEVDRRSDVFAAGAIMWEMLTGEQMWTGVPDTKVLVELASGRIPSPQSVRPEVPDALDAICRKALAFDREARYPTANAFRDAILEWLRDAPPAVAELGTIMTTAFAKERQDMRATVDAEIRAVREASSDSIRQRRVPVLSVPPPAPDGGRSTDLGHSQTASTGGGGRARFALPAAVVGTIVAAGIFYAATLKRSVTPLETHAAAADSPLPSGPAAPHSIHVRISAQPATARFVIDGVAAATNPYDADVISDGTIHAILATADGFESREVDSHFDRDVMLDMSLAPSRTDPGPGPGRPRYTRTMPAGPAPPAFPTHTTGLNAPTQRSTRSIEEEDPYKK